MEFNSAVIAGVSGVGGRRRTVGGSCRRKMVIEGVLTWGGEHTIQCADDVL